MMATQSPGPPTSASHLYPGVLLLRQKEAPHFPFFAGVPGFLTLRFCGQAASLSLCFYPCYAAFPFPDKVGGK